MYVADLVLIAPDEPSWILDPELHIKKGLVVKIMNSTAGISPWANGDQEGKEGVVESVLERGKNGFVHIRTIPDNLILHVPSEYIYPVHPMRPGDKVIPLEGPTKGLVCTAMRFQGGIVDILSDNTTSIMPINKVVKYVEN